MSNTVPAQHPAVVLRSTYQHLRALLAIALIALIGLTVAVVVLAANSSTTASSASHQSAGPPILPRASSRMLRTYSRSSAPVLPKTARYSNAEMNAYARVSSVTAPAIRANASPTVQPNPDRQGLQPQAAQPGLTTDYSGHY